jgi:hypothetical protein
MTRFKNTMEIFKLLEMSNCRKCNLPTCLAFAAQVFKGQKRLSDCPQLDAQIIDRYSGHANERLNIETDQEVAMAELRAKIATIDLAEAAHRINAPFNKGRLSLRILGKTFSVDTNGNLYSDIHIHAWVVIPVLNYILYSKGVPEAQQWVPMRELQHGKDWATFFEHRCVKPLKRIADTYTGLFQDMVEIFNGQKTASHDQADISVVLRPLPNVPILICYWEPEEGLASTLNLFFDATAEENLPIESIYTLGAGLVQMFEKIALRHGDTNQ